MKMIIMTLSLILGFVSTVNAAEEKDQPRHWKRIGNQNHRILKGLADGSLTREEAQDLRQDLRELKVLITKLKADGTLDAADKAKIEAKQDVLSSKIQVKKLNVAKGEPLTEEQIRQFNQNQRVADGIAKGDLTADEAKGLRDYIKANAEVIKAANADGVVTGEEEAFIAARQDLSSDKIYLQRHDEQTRAPASVGAQATAAD